MTTILDDDDALRRLLAPFEDVPPVTRRARRRARLIAAACIALALATAAGIAAADGVNPFAGISTADHAAETGDALDPAIVAMIARQNAEMPDAGPTGQLVASTARLMSTLASGRRIYVVGTTTDALCVLIQKSPGTTEGSAVGCGAPLSQAQPTTEMTIQENQQTPPLAFGVARDDVTAVSFTADGAETTVPVTHNVWAYEGASDIPRSLTVHFADGSEETLGKG